MPRYEYGCRCCGRFFERWKNVEDRDNEETCARCGGEIYRLFSPPQILWKGMWAVKADPNDPEQWR